MKKLLLLTFIILFSKIGYSQNPDFPKKQFLDTIEMKERFNDALILMKKKDSEDEALKAYLKLFEESSLFGYNKGIYISGNNLSVIYSSGTLKNKSLFYAEASYNATKNLSEKKIKATAAYTYGSQLQTENRFSEAIQKYTEAITYYNDIKNYSMEMNTTYAIASIYIDLNLPDKSIEQLKKALKIAEEKKFHRTISIYNSALALNFFSIKEYDSTKYYLDNAKEAIAKVKDGRYKESIIRGMMDTETKLALLNNNYEVALSKADSMLVKAKTKVRRTSDIISSLKNYGDVYMQKGDFKNANSYYKQAYDQSVKFNYRLTDPEIHKNLAKSYAALEKHQLASNSWATFSKLKDSLDKQSSTKQVAYYSELLQNNIKDKEIADKETLILQQEKQAYKRKNFYYYIVSGLTMLCLLVIGGILYFKNKFRKKANKLLYKKNKTITLTQNALKNALNIKTRFLNTITHELRTPLNVIASSIHFLKNDIGNNKNSLTLLDDSSQYLLGYVNNIIEINTFQKNDAQHIENNIIDLRKILHIIFELGLKDLDTNKIVISVDDDVPQLVKSDYTKLSQILHNFSDCLLECIQNNTLTLNLKKGKNDTTFASIDFLFSLPENIINQNRFNDIKNTLISSTTSLVEEKDIRLQIIKKHLQLLPTKIKTTPLSNQITINFGFKNYIPNTNISVENTQNQASILLVEDNKIIQLTTKKILENSGHYCEIANNGLEAVEKYKINNYDLVLMDIMMPVMDGFKAAQEIKKININSKIVALTAVVASENREKFKASGIDFVLSKPVSVDGLNDKINSLLEA